MTQENLSNQGAAMLNQPLFPSLFESGDPNGSCAFLNLATYKIQPGDCNKDGIYFACNTGTFSHLPFQDGTIHFLFQ
jgi:hypothetical protein